MKFLRFTLPAALLVAGILATTCGAQAATASPKAFTATYCFTGVGISANQMGLTASESKQPGTAAISFLKPLTVMQVVPGTPAQAGHVYKGDKIIKVDGKSVLGMTLPQAVALITNGPPGSTVTLTIRRDGNHIQREIKLTRATVCITTH